MILNSESLPRTKAKRIISLVPSITELLFDLGLDEEVIGITKFCVHPNKWYQRKQRVGGTKNLNTDLIKQLKPDLIIANKEENERSQVEELANFCNVLLTDVVDLHGAQQMITNIGKCTHKSGVARIINKLIKDGFSNLTPLNPPVKCAYFIWQEPYMIAGKDTFISDLMLKCGFINFTDQDRYPEISLKELESADCDLILLSSEPYPFNINHLETFRNLLPHKRIELVDGEMFSWYGSRLCRAPLYFQKLIDSIKIF